MKVKVTHVEGSKKGSIESFDLPVLTVGRDPSNALVFDPVKDDRVSTKHAALSEQGGGLIVTDMGSRNGTYVNGQKISGPTPVPSGGLVQFGEHGPMVMIAYEVAAAPAPAPPPAKKSNAGCVILAFVFFVGVAFVVAGAIYFMKGRHKDPWARYGPGSSFEFETQMHMDKPAPMDVKTTTKQTIVSKNEQTVRLKLESTMNGATSATETELPLHPHGEAAAVDKPIEERKESIHVPAGTYDCHYEKRKNGDATTETWKSDQVPMPVKVVTATETTRTTMTLVKVEAK
jgi:hypothetical protein